MDGWKTIVLLLGWPVFRCEALVLRSVPFHGGMPLRDFSGSFFEFLGPMPCSVQGFRNIYLNPNRVSWRLAFKFSSLCSTSRYPGCTEFFIPSNHRSVLVKGLIYRSMILPPLEDTNFGPFATRIFGWPLVGNEGLKLDLLMMPTHSLIPY